MPQKRTHASIQVEESQNKFHCGETKARYDNDKYSSLMKNIEAEKLQEILKELTVLGSKSTVSKHETHTCCREYLTPLVKQRVELSEDLEEEEEDST
ncbi:hypothetical protein J1N35_034309 [Gossypium stocksii]|uniref:Uncharacterized protein n=1 Tax=Gossypium stocksii TaxID=47602 RepID=A0A9D3ZPY7_9ROSI|nr:hypothetical protein J1N35_034309 [Gossypium stocksii]